MTYQEWQRGLIALGYDLGRGGPSGKGDDGIPGRLSQAATIAFKLSQGLSGSVSVGPQSISAMNAALSKAGATKPISATPTVQGLDPVWIIEARRYLGVTEVAGPRSNPTILGWAKRLGAKALGMSYTDDDTPWCGLFVGAMLSATLPKEPLPAILVRAAEWMKAGVPIAIPTYGAIAVFTRAGGGHVGFVVGRSADGKLLRILGGNQSNRVSETWISADRLTGFRYPVTDNNPRRAAPILNAAGALVSRNEA